AWYGPASCAGARTLVVRRGDAPIAAIPTIPFGPAIAGARKVPGPYWPMRAVPLAADCDPLELARAWEGPAARHLGPAWRLGPARADDRGTLILAEAARLAGWQVLSRPAGTAWVIDCAALRAAGWPRASTAKRLRRMERRLERLGTATWQHVRGSGWSEGVLEELGRIEASSWIATETDGRGAKFMTPAQRAQWQAALTDPLLAQVLSTTILRVDGRAAAFTFDCDDGPIRYGIAGSYVAGLASYEIGKLANYRTLADSIADGQQVLDMGAGDSGYKREMGAVEGYRLVDLLFVRHPAAARLMERMWGPPFSTAGTPAHG
ncbi:MAG: GNAT family N-acetyltransferase, partial [Erythrobacter sp.]